MTDLKELEARMLAPSQALIQDISRIKGDIMLLGIGGKMGPSMGKLAVQACKLAGVQKRIIGVSRFSDKTAEKMLQENGVETIACDLLDEAQLSKLPLVKNIIYLAGNKFGTTGNEGFTWAMNTYLPGRVAAHFSASNIVAFSSGNVLPFVGVNSGGACEETAPEPVGEYAQSCLGRERVFEYFSKKNQTPMLIYRLNYAVDFRYGVVHEIAKSVLEGRTIDLSTENVNVIWQGDANEIAIRSLLYCQHPAKILNVTGPEILSVRWIAEQFGMLFQKTPVFTNQSSGTALLNNASACHRLFGYPRVGIREIITATADWITQGGESFGKATHFQERGGKF
ncbi:epimerase [Rhodonellum psychrophilum GCM71 = DSM 17998]|uniref:Epimerase n=2 Tax=Rhodonellum TaxID=336827 RepID=U5BKE9_9BACT|nr:MULTISPECIES: NAD(P)-dependent oxidoreductase [Rhodonellum]ERM80930.1 epimerase [Rhodonellum psychrophilum GCM71 = DSM 17998]MDO9552794.1 NAD(P)-dependent oxidoreductase [Rhodonellum sp.]SDZ31330.1 Nucleoside-diphosphate-sugar epimerase [Rhodonellum ikkaensis]